MNLGFKLFLNHRSWPVSCGFQQKSHWRPLKELYLMRWTLGVMWPSIGDDMGRHWWRETSQLGGWCHAGNVRCEGGWSVMVGAWVLALIPRSPIFSTIGSLHFGIFQKCYKLNVEVLYLLGSEHSVGWGQKQEHTNLCDSCHMQPYCTSIPHTK